ncbi:ribosome production factor 2 [Carex littledalei]|uniref:Ribosome production factor 2 homolog n=1 Tax=Carex littledalei TaxID=544730 RepID=A0A833QXA8_9POAL|nr:ribosome production factor 2 [Carex littledalei]
MMYAISLFLLAQEWVIVHVVFEVINGQGRMVENGKKTLILHGTKTSAVLNSVLTELYHLKRGNAVKFSKKNENIRPFESGGETSLEFFSRKTDCSLFVFGTHSKKRPNNLVLGRTYDHHIYDLVEVGVENFKSMESFKYDKKLTPKIGSKTFFAFIGEEFETVDELKHLKEVLLDILGERHAFWPMPRPLYMVVENLNLTGVDHVFVCTAISPKSVLLMHCAIRLKKSGTTIPRMELVEVGPSIDLVVRRHRLPSEGLLKEAMKTPDQGKKIKNVTSDVIQGKTGRIYMPDQKVGDMPLSNNIKGLKRERRKAKQNKEVKKRKTESE